MSYAFNIFNRLGWLQYALMRLTGASVFAPVPLGACHQEAKFLFGYPRFAFFIQIFARRAVFGSKRPAFFNAAVVMVLIAAFAFEVVEDLSVRWGLAAGCGPDLQKSTLALRISQAEMESGRTEVLLRPCQSLWPVLFIVGAADARLQALMDTLMGRDAMYSS